MPPFFLLLFHLSRENILNSCFFFVPLKSLVIESSVLLIKLFYSQMRYEEATKHLTQLNSPLQSTLADHLAKLRQQQSPSNAQHQFQLPKTDSLRQMQLFAEAHSLKALCLEKKRIASLNAIQNYKLSEEARLEEQEIIDSYELASLFAISHSVSMYQQTSGSSSNSGGASSANVQGSVSGASGANAATASTAAALAGTMAGANTNTLDSINNANLLTLNALNNSDDNMDLINPFYEIALQRAPLLYFKRG